MFNNISATRWSAQQWNELRRKARHYEEELNSKLLTFGKLIHKDMTGDDERDVFGRLNSEIDGLLRTLTDVNNQMSDYWERLPNPRPTVYSLHISTLQRHREILHDYSNEFNKTRDNIAAKLN